MLSHAQRRYGRATRPSRFIAEALSAPATPPPPNPAAPAHDPRARTRATTSDPRRIHDPHAHGAHRARTPADRRGRPRPAPPDRRPPRCASRSRPCAGPAAARTRSRAAQVVAYIDARTVIARLNLLFPGAWHAPTDALPLEMRLTRRNADGTLTPIRLTDQGEVKADDTLYYRCRLPIADATFEDVGAGDDPKAAYSDAIKRAAVRAGIGESLYAMDSPWLRVGDADNQLRISRAGKPYLDERTTRWLQQHVRGVADPGRQRSSASRCRTRPRRAARRRRRRADRRAAAPAAARARPAPTSADGNLAAVAAPAIPDIPEAGRRRPGRPREPPSEAARAADAHVSEPSARRSPPRTRPASAPGRSSGSRSSSPPARPTPPSSSRTSTTSSPPSSPAASAGPRRRLERRHARRAWSRRRCAPSATAHPPSDARRSASTSTGSPPRRRRAPTGRAEAA